MKVMEGRVHTRRREFAGEGGIRLVGDESGEGHQPLVLLLHGGGQTRHSWLRTQKKLTAAGLHVVSLDLRGHGESGWSTTKDYGLDRFAADVSEVLAQLGNVPTVLVGASLGGLCSMLVAGERMIDWLEGVILVDVVHRANPAGVSNIRGFMHQRHDGFASVEEAAEAVAKYLPHRKSGGSLNGLRRNLREKQGRWYWHWDPAFVAPREDGTYRRIDADRLIKAVQRVDVPTLLLRGELSEIVTDDLATEFIGLLPGAEQRVIPGARHMVAGDDNEIFTNAVLEFLHGLVLRSGLPAVSRQNAVPISLSRGTL